MLIRERLETCDFSNSERAVVAFILEKKLEIRDMTTKEIAREAFASPSTLVRVAQKMGFSGWNGLKEAFLKEEGYLGSHFQDIDANLPFQRGDPIMSIAGKIASLRKEAIDDTRALLLACVMGVCILDLSGNGIGSDLQISCMYFSLF